MDRAAAAAEVLRSERPDLTLVYLPHLDYDPQRFGPSGCDMARLVRELDDACAPLLDAAADRRGAGLGRQRVRPCRREPADLPESRAARGRAALRSGRARSARSSTRSAAGPSPSATISWPMSMSPDPTIVPRARDADRRRCPAWRGSWRATSVARSAWITPAPASSWCCREPTAWFAYPYWLDDRLAPDFARTVDIHRKPGYDPCELFFDPTRAAGPRAVRLARLLQKKLGFRTLFDVIPLDAGAGPGQPRPPRRPRPTDRPILIGDGPPPALEQTIPMTDVHGLLLRALLPG